MERCFAFCGLVCCLVGFFLMYQSNMAISVAIVRLKEQNRKGSMTTCMDTCMDPTTMLKVLPYLRRYLHKCHFMLISLSPCTYHMLVACSYVIYNIMIGY